MRRPRFDELPLHEEDPPFSAWRLYGPDDELGCLNLLTPEVVKEASKEIQTGIRIGLDGPLNYLKRAPHNRQNLTHTIIHKEPRAVHDDVLIFNSQISAQWDGFRHFGYQERKVFYNGAKVEDLSGVKADSKLGIQDYLHWARSQGKNYDLLGDHALTVDELKAVAEFQKVEFKKGDILIIRTGFHAGYEALSEEEKIAWSYGSPMKHVGVETSLGMARWLWDTGFCACAGDSPAFERMPKQSSIPGDLFLHELILSGWGMPIGEMWSLDALGEECRKQNRYSFFLTSMPLNVDGLVGSPANVMAIF
ncbi:hypothetical protein CLAIMM_00117 [Cladophialophora immunda]|nr:hypothetical protein CLAIMM_00117 [Cladophialophora immunda]